MARTRPRHRQPDRWRNRHRAPARLQRHPHRHHAGSPPPPHRWTLRPRHDVHRRGSGHRRGHRESQLTHTGAAHVPPNRGTNEPAQRTARRGPGALRPVAQPTPCRDHEGSHPTPARLRRGGRPAARRVVRRHPVPDRHGQDLRRRPPGVHPVERHARREHPRGDDQPRWLGRQHREHRARPVLRAGVARARQGRIDARGRRRG